jgi:hypothetical protein
MGDRSLRAVHPDGGLDFRLETFSQLEDRIARDRWSPFGLGALLLLGDRLANSGQAS